MVFEQVQADLEAAGYEVWTYILPAAGIGAPHRRERVWIVAHAGGDGCGKHSAVSQFDDIRNEEGMAGKHDADPLPGGGSSSNSDRVHGEGWFADRFRHLFETAGTFPGGEPARGVAAPDWKALPFLPGAINPFVAQVTP